MTDALSHRTTDVACWLMVAGTPLFNGIITKDDALVDGITNTDSVLMVEIIKKNTTD